MRDPGKMVIAILGPMRRLTRPRHARRASGVCSLFRPFAEPLVQACYGDAGLEERFLR